MKTTLAQPADTSDDLEVSVSTARLLLQQALRREQLKSGDEEPEVARKRALKELTGASLDVPAKVAPQEDALGSAATAAGGLREIVMIKNARPDE
jgi:hypothetical protein